MKNTPPPISRAKLLLCLIILISIATFAISEPKFAAGSGGSGGGAAAASGGTYIPEELHPNGPSEGGEYPTPLPTLTPIPTATPQATATVAATVAPLAARGASISGGDPFEARPISPLGERK